MDIPKDDVCEHCNRMELSGMRGDPTGRAEECSSVINWQ